MIITVLSMMMPGQMRCARIMESLVQSSEVKFSTDHSGSEYSLFIPLSLLIEAKFYVDGSMPSTREDVMITLSCQSYLSLLVNDRHWTPSCH